MSQRFCVALILFLMAAVSKALVPQNNPTIQQSKLYAEPSQETAAALTAYMAKAHEEKVAAMARVEAQYKEEIESLKAQVAELQGPATAEPSASANNSFAFPATNRGLAEKVVSYQKFISKYIVKAQSEKQKAVQEAERATAAKYEAKIEAMLAPVPPQQ